MDPDISQLLANWDYKPGQVVVRRFKGQDGSEKIQLRVDLGVLQMNAEGRPDGKRPFGHESLFDYYQSRLYRHVASHGGSDQDFKLDAEDCSKLQLEALQFHHRYICLLQLGDYNGVVRDAERNLAVFEFVAQHAANEELVWSFRQFQPQLMMILTRARAMQFLDVDDYTAAIDCVELGLQEIREFHRAHMRTESSDPSGELQSLEAWLGEIKQSRPLTPREKLEQALNEAIRLEDYEKAAKVRDALRELDSKVDSNP